MRERIASGFDPFVIPFLVGMAFVLLYCAYGAVRLVLQLDKDDRRRFLLSLVSPPTALKNIKDIFLNCLVHVRLWKRNRLLGYMHSSIAFGWFMLILLGHIEVFLFCPQRLNLFYYPIFFNYFVAEADASMRGALLFFLMDFFLLMVLSGIVLAMIKRVRSLIFGMRRTTRLSFLDRIGLYSLWSIFPLRLLAESFTAHISGGSFLTIPMNWLFRQFLGNNLNMLPTWWAYSIALCVFMCVLPFTRYMHIPTEMLLIPMRNAGLHIKHARRGFALAEIYSCPGCGVCIDACPMSVRKANVKYCTVYLNRQIRRRNEDKIDEISDKCLLCGKCEAVCQVGVEGPALRISQRARREYSISPDYSNISLCAPACEGGTLYFEGCMGALVPRIGKAVASVLDKAGVSWKKLDPDSGVCCGRPVLMAGRTDQARQLIEKNTAMIMESGCDTLLLSCPICYKVFRENYNLPGVRVIHHSEYFNELVREGKLQLEKKDICYVYHDPCELGRGCGVYEAPRQLIGKASLLMEAGHNHSESICCGGSLGSLSLSYEQRAPITRHALEDLVSGKPDAIATACPLCQFTFSRYADRPVRDIAEIVNNSIIK